MAWKDDLQPSSYGGISFYSASVAGKQGRNIKVHKRINNTPLSEDIGSTGREYTVKGYFIESRDTPDPYREFLKLRNLVLLNIPREFIHPHYGFISRAQAVSVVENVRNTAGGYVEFTLQIDANQKISYTPPKPRSQVALRNASSVLQVDAEVLFGFTPSTPSGSVVGPVNIDPVSPLKTFKIPTSPISRIGLAGTFGRFTDRVKQIKGALDSRGSFALERLSAPVGNILDNYYDLTSVANDVTFVLNGFSGVDSLNGPLEVLQFFVNNPLRNIGKNVLPNEDDNNNPRLRDISGGTRFHQEARENEDAFGNYVALSGLAVIGQNLGGSDLRATLPSRDEALRFSRRLLDAANSEHASLTQDGAERSALGLSNWLASIVDYEDEYLPQLSRVRVVDCQTLNALETTYRYNGDISLLENVARENNILHAFNAPPQLNLRRV